MEYEEEYFEDMMYEPSSILKDYLVFSYDGYDYEDSFDLNLGLEEYYYRYYIESLDDLDDRIKAHAHVVSGANIFNLGGNHDVLFYLNSLDLDLRCDYKLGAICGYGREKY